eukprot:gene6751-7846_t
MAFSCNTILSTLTSITCVASRLNIAEDQYQVEIVVDNIAQLETTIEFRIGLSGGNVTLFGSYGPNVTDVYVHIGANCPVSFFNSSVIVCNLPSGEGIKDIQIKVNNVVWRIDNGYRYEAPTDSIINVNTTGFNLAGSNIETMTFIYSIRENFYNSTMMREFITDNWVSESIGQNKWIYSITTPEKSKITLTIDHIEQAKDVNFAGTTLHLDDNTVKVSVNISGWMYAGALNNLQVVIKSNSTLLDTPSSCNDEPSSTSFHGDSNTLDYFTIQLKNSLFYGRFIDRVLSDGRPTYSSVVNLAEPDSTITIGINLPFCRECILDPGNDFLFIILITTIF